MNGSITAFLQRRRDKNAAGNKQAACPSESDLSHDMSDQSHEGAEWYQIVPSVRNVGWGARVLSQDMAPDVALRMRRNQHGSERVPIVSVLLNPIADGHRAEGGKTMMGVLYILPAVILGGLRE
jgi:hypothetical protein